jgi:uncharacterized protein (DUF433 family)
MLKPDPIDVPLYSLHAVARWVGIPPTTLHKWVYGRDYPAGGRIRRSRPLITPADPKTGKLSFANIAEAHLLNVTRKYRISMADVRAAIDLVQRSQPGAKHPLLTGHFYRRGKYIFVDYLSTKIAASRPIQGQPLLGHEFDEYLERIERDERGKVLRLFPVRHNERKTIVLNSGVAGGQPIIAGTGILVEYVQDLRKAGLSAPEIAAQYGLDEEKIVEAIRYIAA